MGRTITQQYVDWYGAPRWRGYSATRWAPSPDPCTLYQMQRYTRQDTVYQIHIILYTDVTLATSLCDKIAVCNCVMLL